MYGKMQESGLTEIIPLICTSAIGVSILCFLILSFLRVHRQGAPAVSGGLMAGILFPSWIPSGLPIWVAIMWWLDDCNILCLLIWQVIFFIHIGKHLLSRQRFYVGRNLSGHSSVWKNFISSLRKGRKLKKNQFNKADLNHFINVSIMKKV